MLSKMLVSIDGPENSFRALEHAIFLTKLLETQIIVLYIIEEPPTVYI